MNRGEVQGSHLIQAKFTAVLISALRDIYIYTTSFTNMAASPIMRITTAVLEINELLIGTTAHCNHPQLHCTRWWLMTAHVPN